MTRTARWTLGLGVLGAFVWSAWATEVSASRVVEGLPFMLDFIRRMVPPDLSVMGHALHGAIQTLEIAVVGTLTAAVLALPMGFAAARSATATLVSSSSRVKGLARNTTFGCSRPSRTRTSAG